VPTKATVSTHMQGANTGVNLITGRTTRDIRAIVQCGKCSNKRTTIHAGLASPRILDGPAEDGEKVLLGRFRQADAPALPGQV